MKIPQPKQWKKGTADHLFNWVMYGNGASGNTPLTPTQKTKEDIIENHDCRFGRGAFSSPCLCYRDPDEGFDTCLCPVHWDENTHEEIIKLYK